MHLDYLLAPLVVILSLVIIFTLPFAILFKTLSKKPKYVSWLMGLFIAIILVGLVYRLLLTTLSANIYFPAYFYRYNRAEIITFGIGIMLAVTFYVLNLQTAAKKYLILASGLLLLGYSVIAFFILVLFDPGSSVMFENYHYFNDHIKSLCVYREDKSECPRTEEDLASFNQEKWNEFTSAATVNYSFDETTGTYIYTAEDHAWKMFNNDNDPGYFDVKQL